MMASSRMMASDSMTISRMAMMRARDVSLTSVMISLDIGGTIRLMTCTV
jgi:hypothetical protein